MEIEANSDDDEVRKLHAVGELFLSFTRRRPLSAVVVVVVVVVLLQLLTY
jgi:hypothetical protein